jgi:transposase
MELTEKVRKVIKDAAKKLTGYKRRQYVAQTTLDLLDGNARQAERIFGWGRKTVEKGLRELETGFRCVDNYQARGRKKSEEKLPELAQDIVELVDPHSQAEPRFKNVLAYTRLTAKAVRQALIDEKEYTDEQLPGERTISNMLNRLDKIIYSSLA